jgi:hypothetical protein
MAKVHNMNNLETNRQNNVEETNRLPEFTKPNETNSNDEPKEKGIMAKIKASKPYQQFEELKKLKTYHFIKAFLSYVALLTLVISLSAFSDPPQFPYPTLESDIKSATEFNAGKPTNSPLFVKLADMTGNEKMKNTKYIYAAENGKAAVRVCTDLSKEEFEKIAGIKEKDELRWDALWYNEVKALYELGCVNASILAYNGGCTENPVYPPTKSDRGNCGTPNEAAKLFTNPISNSPGGNGWLWHYMIRTNSEFNPWPGSKLSTYRNCSTTECDVAKCYNQDCYDTSQICHGWYETKKECGSSTKPKNGTYAKSCNEIVTKHSGNGYCNCGDNRRVYMCDSGFAFKCADTCKCVMPSLMTSACSNICTCNETTTVQRSEPDWMIANPQFHRSADSCHAAFGRFNTINCEQNNVLSYGQQTQWIVNLFLAATIIRLIYQYLCIYWGCTEDHSDYRILFACETLLRAYYVCKVGTIKINEVEEKQFLQGWPWLLGLVDAILVTVATLGVAYGADPFPDLGKGRTELFFLWISAIREALELCYKLYNAYSKKAYYVSSKSHNVECCSKTIPWCYGSNADEEEVKAEVELNNTMTRSIRQQGLLVTIPSGISGGQQMMVNVPNKGPMMVTVPMGLQPGQSFQVAV